MASILKPGDVTGQVITEIGAAPGPDVVTYSADLPSVVEPGVVYPVTTVAPIDYRALLVKYMRTLLESEGDLFDPGMVSGVTLEEIETLVQLNAEVRGE